MPHTLARGTAAACRRPAAARWRRPSGWRRRSGRSSSSSATTTCCRQPHRRRQAALAGRLGICRLQLARCSTSAASPPTASMSAAEREALLEAYFGRAARRGAAAPALRAMTCRLAAARDDVEHGLGAPFGDRLRLRRLHRREPRPLRGGLRGLQGERGMTRPARLGARWSIIGGGIVGCSTAYHLGADGLERRGAARAAPSSPPARPGTPRGWSASCAPTPTSPSCSAIRSSSTTGWRPRPGWPPAGR